MRRTQKLCASKRSVARWLALGMALVLVGTLSGCDQSKQSGEDTGFLSSDQVTTLEGLYGQEIAGVLEELGLKEEDVTTADDGPGMWTVSEPATFAGKELEQWLLFDASSQTLYGRRYRYVSQDTQEALEMAESFVEKANQAYGEPTTYPAMETRITGETFQDDFTTAMESGERTTWTEEWAPGEQTTCTLTVMVGAANTAALTWDYAITVTR